MARDGDAVVEAGVAPDVHHLVDFAEFGGEKAHQVAQVFALHPARGFGTGPASRPFSGVEV
jgi:hypothetical protein